MAYTRREPDTRQDVTTLRGNLSMSPIQIILIVGMTIGAFLIQFCVARFIIGFQKRSVRNYLVEFVSVGLLARLLFHAWLPAVGIVLAIVLGTWLAAVYLFYILPWLQKMKQAELEHRLATQPSLRLVPDTGRDILV